MEDCTEEDFMETPALPLEVSDPVRLCVSSVRI